MNLKYLMGFFFAFSLFFIQGCDEDDGRTHITIWHQMRVDERQVLEQQLQRFMEIHPDFKVEQLYKEPEKLRSGYIIAATAGQGPDLVYGPSEQIGPLQVMDIILPLEQFLDSTYLGQFNPKALTWYAGHLYQIADKLGKHLRCSVIIMIPSVALFLFLSRWLVSGLTLGSVKG